MKIERWDNTTGTVGITAGSPCPCGCSPHPFVYIRDEAQGITAHFETAEELRFFQEQVAELSFVPKLPEGTTRGVPITGTLREIFKARGGRLTEEEKRKLGGIRDKGAA